MASAATPSPRPVRPRPSVVVAEIDTGAPMAPPRAASASARRGLSFGRLPMTWTEALPMRKPAARTRRAVSSSMAVPAAPAHSGSDVPKFEPEVAQAGRRQQGVAQRVGGGVAVGVALEPLRLAGPGQPGQVKRHALGVPVHVDAQPDPGQVLAGGVAHPPHHAPSECHRVTNDWS